MITGDGKRVLILMEHELDNLRGDGRPAIILNQPQNEIRI